MCRELLIVEEGTVKTVESALSERQQLLGIERKGSSLAEVAVFDGGRYPASAEATSSTTLLRLSADSSRQTCLKNPEMALKVFKVLAHRLRHLASLVEGLSLATVRARLIAYLVRLAEENGHRTPPSLQAAHFAGFSLSSLGPVFGEDLKVPCARAETGHTRLRFRTSGKFPVQLGTVIER